MTSNGYSSNNKDDEQDIQNTYHTPSSQIAYSKCAPKKIHGDLTSNNEMTCESEDDHPTSIQENSKGKIILDAASRTYSAVYNSDDEEQGEEEADADIDGSLEEQNSEEAGRELDHPRFGGKQPGLYVLPKVDNTEPDHEPDHPRFGGKQIGLYAPRISSSRDMIDRDSNGTDEDEASDGDGSDFKATPPASVSAMQLVKTKVTRKVKPKGATTSVVPMPAGTVAFPHMKYDACRNKKAQSECQFARFGQSCRQYQRNGATCRINDQPVSSVVWPAWRFNNPTVVNQAAYDTVAPLYSEPDPGDRKKRVSVGRRDGFDKLKDLIVTKG